MAQRTLSTFWTSGDVSIPFPKPALLRTDGRGLWSKSVRNVRISRIYVGAYEWDGYQSGELNVVFTHATWNPSKHGLIYTDKTWLRGLKALLRQAGLSAHALRNLDYSEQGRQGGDFVNLDVDASFLRAVERLLSK
jgi:hypothetical protein